MTMANLHADPLWLAQIVDRDQIHATGAQGSRVQILLVADHDLALVALDLDHVQRRAGGHAQTLALAYGEVVDSVVLADYFPFGGHEFAGCVGQRLALLGQIGIEKLLVVAAGDKADLLRIWLGGESEAVMARQVANLRLGHFTERKIRMRQLLLGQAEQKVRLILRGIGGALEQPAAALLVELDPRVVARGDASAPIC